MCKTCHATAGNNDCLTCNTGWDLGPTSKKCEINLATTCSGVCQINCGAGNCGTTNCDKTACTKCGDFNFKVMIGAYPTSGTAWPTTGECIKANDCPSNSTGIFHTTAEGTTGSTNNGWWAGTNVVPEMCVYCKANCLVCRAASRTDLT